MAGAALAAVYHRNGLPSLSQPLAVACTIPVVGLAVLPSQDLYTTDLVLIQYGGVAIAAAAVLAIWGAVAGARWLEVAWLRWFGLISSALYLWHQLLLQDQLLTSWDVELRGLVLVSLATVISWVSYLAVERPALRLKGKWGSPRSRSEKLAGATLEPDPTRA